MIASALAGSARLVAGSTVRSLSGAEMDTTQRIYIANHSSHLDFIVLWAHLPPRTRALARPVAAADYWSTGIRRYLAEQVFHAVLIARNAGPGDAAGLRMGHQALVSMAEALGDRHSLILFPEGSRSTGEMGPFHSGLFHLCRLRPDVDVMPVYMENLNRILPKGETLPVPMLSRIIFGLPFRLEVGETKAAFMDRAWHAVGDLRKA